MKRPLGSGANRFDPYKNYRFRVFFEDSKMAVAGMSKVSGLKRSSYPIEKIQASKVHRVRHLGQSKYEAIMLERGVTHDRAFAEWAAAGPVPDQESNQRFRSKTRTIHIVRMDEQGQPLARYAVFRCWVSEYQALPDLDAGSNVVNIEHLKVEHEGLRDETVT